jgi:HlyD family secretion protein
MNPQRLLVAGLVLTAVAILATLAILPSVGRGKVLSGYVEGESLYLAAPVSGTVTKVTVARGDRVTAGQALFVVDPRQLAAQRDQAAAEVASAQAEAQDVRKGQRPVELAILEANAAAAEARARDAAAILRRTEPLVRKGIYAPARLDDARAAAQAAQSEVVAAKRQRDAAALGARDDQVRAADSRVHEAQAVLAAASARAGDAAPTAPKAGRIEEVFFQTGEWAAANQPVVALLPDDRVKLRFFVPEAAVSAYRPGGVVAFACDGCAAGLKARITYVSPRPEFTPPVIYSREARDRLVYLVEAKPGVLLNPGQPVDVTPLRPAK